MYANTQGGGQDFATPDVCLTPSGPTPVPMTYPNTAQGTMGAPGMSNIMFAGCPVHNMTTNITLTTGDSAGVNLGVTSGTVMGPSRHTAGATSVLVKGSPITRVSSPTMQNSTNAPGSRTSPSQTKVSILAS
ncbi:hypothetical protein Xmau_01154 [Xenorhabdus mauleonii]|uniref:Uncharacterized protein n=1 Tax=Xenorhabdus mauleonii TaxID=351675 RepID=A0A1I3MGP8_9GAMM|nr:DUF4150 domain-containing protein [Xenorhabdus mauleonii]PHM45502.1 hypothetical protein Xmau_01154 [Xenorhabdus mauleonii]SFI95895.1 protein of unknown function [Xenorhabdus mauleonii]